MNLLWQSVCVIAFGATCWAVGDLLRRRFFDESLVLSGMARHTLAFTAGNVALSYFLTVLGFVGGFVPSALWAMFLSGVGFAVLRIATAFKRSLAPGLGEQPIQGEKEKKEVLILLAAIAGLFLLSAILQAAAPPYVRDSLVYHLLCPKEYLKAERLIHINGNLYSAFPKGHEVLMTLLLAISGDRAAQGFSILQQVATIAGLYSLTRLMAGPWSSVVCTLGYATVPPVIYFSGCGYVEPALLMTFGSSLLALFIFFKSSGTAVLTKKMNLKALAFIGFLAGWMFALKYSGLIYAGLIGLILLWSHRRVPIKKALSLSGVFILTMIPGLCWMVWNWIDFGNPVYPMAWFLFGGKDWDEARAFVMSIYFDTYGMGRNLSDLLLLPWRLAFSGRFDTIRFDGAIGPFLLLFLALALASGYLSIRGRSAGAMMKQIGFMFIVSAAFFMFGTQQTRFWLPSQMLVCAFAAPAVELLVNWTRNRRLIMTVLFLTLVSSLAWNMWFLGRQFLLVGYYRSVLGMEEERSFLIRKVPGYPALEFINQNLPAHSRILSVWTGAYGYYFDRPYYSDTFIEDATLKRIINASANGRELSQRLTQAGFTHLFLNLSILGKNMEQNERAIFDQFLGEDTRELYRYKNYGVFEIHRQ